MRFLPTLETSAAEVSETSKIVDRSDIADEVLGCGEMRGGQRSASSLLAWPLRLAMRDASTARRQATTSAVERVPMPRNASCEGAIVDESAQREVMSA